MLSAARKRTASCLSWVKLRNTQNEQMSSALLPRTDVGLAGPNVTRIERYGKFDERPLCVESRCDAVALGSNISVSAPFVRRCLTGSTISPFSHPAHRTGQADFPHPALGQNFTPSPTARRAQACSGVRARSARKDARVDSSRPCDAWFCA